MTPSWTSPHGRPLPPIGGRTLIMGVLNATPDSFSDGGLHLAPGAAADQAARLLAEGADIVDLGGESTRPGHAPVGEAEELRRVLPAIAAIRARCPGLPLSIDTTKPAVAAAAIAAGADVINDISGLTAGIAPEVLAAACQSFAAGRPDFGALLPAPMAVLAARLACPLIVMHPAAPARAGDFWTEILAGLRLSLALAERTGVPPHQLWVDPGFGFGKTVPENLELVKNLSRLAVLGRPVLLGPSRKSTIGHVLGRPVDQRLEGTAASVVWAIAQGCQMVRVHEVAALRPAIRMADALAHGLGYDLPA